MAFKKAATPATKLTSEVTKAVPKKTASDHQAEELGYTPDARSIRSMTKLDLGDTPLSPAALQQIVQAFQQSGVAPLGQVVHPFHMPNEGYEKDTGDSQISKIVKSAAKEVKENKPVEYAVDELLSMVGALHEDLDKLTDRMKPYLQANVFVQDEDCCEKAVNAETHRSYGNDLSALLIRINSGLNNLERARGRIDYIIDKIVL